VADTGPPSGLAEAGRRVWLYLDQWVGGETLAVAAGTLRRALRSGCVDRGMDSRFQIPHTLTLSAPRRFNFPAGSVELYAEKVLNRGLCSVAQAESLRFKLLGGLAVRRWVIESLCAEKYQHLAPKPGIDTAGWKDVRKQCGSELTGVFSAVPGPVTVSFAS